MSLNIRNGLSSAVAVSVFSNALCIGMAGLASIPLARLLGPEGRGQFAAIIVWSTLACAAADLGISQSCTYYGAQRPHGSGLLAGTAVSLSVCAGFLSMSVLQLCASTLGRELAPARLYFLFIPVSMAITCLSNILLGMGHIGSFNLIRLIQSSAPLLGVVAAWATGGTQIAGLVNALLFFQVIAAVVAFTCVSRAIPFTEWAVNHSVAKDLLNYGLRTYLGNLCWLANGKLDQALLVWLATMTELGTYTVAVSYASLQLAVSGAIATVAFSRIARATSQKGRRQEFCHSLRLFAILTIPLALSMGCIANFSIPIIYGMNFRASSSSACILLVGGVLLGFNHLFSNSLRAEGRPGVPAIAEAVGMVLTVGALPVAVTHWGIVGASCVSVASYAATSATMTMLWIRHCRMSGNAESTSLTAIDAPITQAEALSPLIQACSVPTARGQAWMATDDAGTPTGATEVSEMPI